MKLLRLTLKNFGPYSAEENIDFRSLRYSKLFLIHGPVGSGKTFILDGICFALYGRSSGGERDKLGLRNLSAEPTQETAVSLDFESGEQSYRVERRFSGSSEEENDDVSLSRLPEIGEPTRRDILSATPGGVAAMVANLLGLSAEQFCQVGILPQGRFRRFLLAESEQRREILSSMFASTRHARFQESIGKAHESAKEKWERAWSQREELIGLYADAGGDPRESLTRSTEELKTVSEDCSQHQEKSVEWEKSLEEAVRYEILDRQRDMSERELQALTGEGEESQNDLTNRLREAIPLYEKWKRKTEETEVISAELHEQRTQYENMKSDTNIFEDEVRKARQLEEERFSLRRSIERLEMLQDDCRGVQVLEQELIKTQTRLEELSAKRSELVRIFKKDKADGKLIKAELEKITEAEAKLGGLKRDLEDISEQRDRARQSDLLSDALEQAEQRETRLEQLVDKLEAERKEAAAELREHRARDLHETLLALKKSLNPDQECPLCGSTEHPNPYSERRRRLEDEPDEERVELLDRKLQTARRELVQAKERRVRLEGRREEHDGDIEAPDIDEATIRRLQQTVQVVEQRVAKKNELKRQLRQIKVEAKPVKLKLKKMRLLKERLNSTLESIESQRKARKQAAAKVASELIPGLGQFNFEEVEGHLEKERERLKQRLDNLAEVTYGTERAELMAETFALQLAESRASEKERDRLRLESEELRETLLDRFRREFASWDDLSFALGRLSRETSVQNGQGQVLDRDTLVRTVERQLHQSQELLATLPVPEMKAEQIRQALSREREHLEQKVSRRAYLERSLETSAEDVARYDRLVEEIRDLESLSQSYGRLRALAEGTEEKPDFHEWYLERVFRRVLTAANLRLEILAPNRFSLVLYHGLEVRIMDFSAGKERSATTLSGGESFLASLALALGLGDVLQAERNVKDRLQTLFIDEGFGYLDRRALEASLDCLESLKQEGRTVGIISHVRALRERIRAQVVVASNDSPLPYGTERVQIFA